MSNELPAMSSKHHPRLAKSKALVKVSPSTQTASNVLSTQQLIIQSPDKSAKPAEKSDILSGLPTPPSDSPDAKLEKNQVDRAPATDNASDVSTPVKLRIQRSIQKGKYQLMSTVVNSSESGGESTTAAGAGKMSPDVDDIYCDNLSLQSVRIKRLKLKKAANTVNMPPGGAKSGDRFHSPSGVQCSMSRNSVTTHKPAAKDTCSLPQKTPSINKPPKWLVGDLVWSKVSGHPWWPCMVAYDPISGVYTKLSGGNRTYRLYHVQFFGDEAERGWIAEASTIKFEGLAAFQQLFLSQLEAAPNKTLKAKVLLKFDVPPRSTEFSVTVSAKRKAAWKVGVKSAEGALPFSRNERKHLYTFVYEDLAPKTAKTNNPERAEDTSENQCAAVVKDSHLPNIHVPGRNQCKYKRHSAGNMDLFNGNCNRLRECSRLSTVSLNNADDAMTDYHFKMTSVPSVKKRHSSSKPAALGSPQGLVHDDKDSAHYLVFSQKRKGEVQAEQPELTEVMAEQCLKKLWDQSDDECRSKCIAESADVKNLDGSPFKENSGCKSSSQLISTSKRKLEDEEDIMFIPKRKRFLSCEGSKEKENVQIEQTAECTVSSPEQSEGLPKGHEKSKRRRTKATDLSKSRADHHNDIIKTKSDSLGCNSSCPTSRASPKQDEEIQLEIFKLSNAGPQKKENICQICEEPGELIECQGSCQGRFHPICLGVHLPSNGVFKCDECMTGIHTCFVCKAASSDVKKCSVSQCGRYYHRECVKKFPLTRNDGRGFYCPLHTCVSCSVDPVRCNKASTGRLLKCIRCPTAYHVGDFCIAAGSENLAGFHIVCSNHFQPVKSQAHHSHIHVSWCFICSTGGTLICCESCPAAFHAECLGIKLPEGLWTCGDCSKGKKPRYGNIIWVKLGNYRWWPGEICHPKNVPLNIQVKPHGVGEFPVRFFGSNEYFWTHQARVFMFQEGDKANRVSTNAKSLVKVFQKGVKEATEAFRDWQEFQEGREQVETEKNERKPPPYKFVKSNVPIKDVQIYKVDASEIPKCECRKDTENPCSSDTDCLNRMLMYECHASVCPAGSKCCNQRFQKRQYPHSEPFKTKSRGWGLRTLVDIKKGQFVNEYVGDLVDGEECHRRIKMAHEENVTNFYMLTLDKNRVIDAGPKGNLSRFMNHSCNPNCETQKWHVNGDVRIGLFALRDIAAGEELNFNYNLECLGSEKTVCECGAINCSGFLGVRPKSAAALAAEKKAKEVKKKKRRKCRLDVKKEHDGKWACPWHHCDVCGKNAVKLCAECPNSFCKDHLDERIFQNAEGKLICFEHKDLLQTMKTTSVVVEKSVCEKKASQSLTKSECSQCSRARNNTKLKKLKKNVECASGSGKHSKAGKKCDNSSLPCSSLSKEEVMTGSKSSRLPQTYKRNPLCPENPQEQKTGKTPKGRKSPVTGQESEKVMDKTKYHYQKEKKQKSE